MLSFNFKKRGVSKRILLFGIVAITTIIGIALVNHSRGLLVSAKILYFFAGTIFTIICLDSMGYKRFMNAAIVLTVNFFLTLVSMAEGLKTGGFLFILPTIFALVFMLGNTREYKFEVIGYFVFTIMTFAFCVLFIPAKSNWQVISDEIYSNMYTTNALTVVVLCALFAYIGIYFERKVYAKLIDEKNKAEQLVKTIKEQNVNLRDYAFMSSHTVRAPLSNILGLTAIINHSPDDSETRELVITGIASSAKELDKAIHAMVLKSGSISDYSPLISMND